ncbi:MAG: aa3-type cytochrome c oxidase subunit IV [Pseudomonadota bacterium]
MAGSHEPPVVNNEEVDRAKHYYGFFIQASKIVSVAIIVVLVLMAIFLL